MGPLNVDAGELPWRLGDGAPLDSLAIPALRADLLQHGAVALRGFTGGVPSFARLTRVLFPHTMRAAVHRGAHPLYPHVKSATPGGAPQGFHADYAHLPRRVDAMAFHCEVPGARTRLCDGARLWEALPAAVQAHLREQPVVLVAWHDAAAWMAATGARSLQEVQAHADAHGGYQVLPGPLGGMFTRVVRPAAEEHRGRLCLTQNLWKDAYAALQLLALDGQPYSPEALLQVHATADRVAWDLTLQPGDTLLLDNRRFLHARDAQPPGRRVWVVLGYWDA